MPPSSFQPSVQPWPVPRSRATFMDAVALTMAAATLVASLGRRRGIRPVPASFPPAQIS
jgi:hypothetical protein